MRRLMTQLPEPNYSTAMFILDHLIKYVTTGHITRLARPSVCLSVCHRSSRQVG